MSGVVSVDHDAAPTMVSGGNQHELFTELDPALVESIVERYAGSPEHAPEKVGAGQISAFGSSL
jgi:hypothetical protein